ncbi:SDR family NAD(P)-dependent oxidoreductase [Sphingomonas sp. KC8]|uniref:SDR family NAD(P)-dependent oxidoreductase n=1 Tax=Sphingomonas sp. KC8 TaxID=1030157 RepID=UPI000248BBC1|nr:SDR family oxidoreductase [Sphingomonas sp. KC8]ARS26885.1 short-chain dehydrogenase [Sphingomonas sp. KC8]
MTDDNRALSGKVAIITGGGSGIGKATAKLLAGRGARVAVTGRTIGKLTETVRELEALGTEALAVAMDVADEVSVAEGIGRVASHFGRIDILHSNAAQTGSGGLNQDGAITEMDAAFWDQTMAINLRGSMLVAKHGIPHLLKAGGGSIIFTGSGKGLSGDLDYPAYGTSKAGLINLARYIATQYGKQAIRSNVVVVGLVMTEALDDNLPPAVQSAMLEHHLTPQLGRPEDIAEVVAFLASDQSRFVTGAAITADGGFTAHSAMYADMNRWAAMAREG